MSIWIATNSAEINLYCLAGIAASLTVILICEVWKLIR